MIRQRTVQSDLKIKQHGAALIVSLVLLLVLSLLGVSSMQGTVMEERMAGNMYDRNLAFQAAEAALRAGEDDVLNEANQASYYDAEVAGSAVPDGLNDDAVWATTTAIAYTGGLAGLSDAPEYIIERQRPPVIPEFGVAVPDPLFIVSARGAGRNGASVVVLQSVYKR